MNDPVLWTAWIASGLFFISEAGSSALLQGRTAQQAVNAPSGRSMALCSSLCFGVLGLIVLCVHIGLAYVLTHQGSHIAAVEHVAKQTELVIGVRNGAGIYFNFLTVFACGFYLFGFRDQRPLTKNFARLRFVACVYLWCMFISARITFATVRSAIVFGLLASGCLICKIAAGRHATTRVG